MICVNDCHSKVSLNTLSKQNGRHRGPTVLVSVSKEAREGGCRRALSPRSDMDVQIRNSPPTGKLSVVKAIVTVDEVGRLVLPKAIRVAIGVSGRMTVKK